MGDLLEALDRAGLSYMESANAAALYDLESVERPSDIMHMRPVRTPRPDRLPPTDRELREVLIQNQAFFLRSWPAYELLARQGYAALVKRSGPDIAARLVQVQAQYLELLIVHKFCRDQLPESKGVNL